MDFFSKECETDCGQCSEFWIFDNAGAQRPAYVKGSDAQDSIAHVRNSQEFRIKFRAIDQCMIIQDDNGKEQSRCDCMLEYENDSKEIVFHFVELKQRKKGSWQSDGFGQLRNTIRLFIDFNPSVQINNIKAQLCNSMRPSFSRPRPQQLKLFKDELSFVATNVMLGRTVLVE